MKSQNIHLRSKWVIALVVGMVMCAGSVAVSAQKIFLNDTDITKSQLKNQKLERVNSVEFDADGNIHIDAPAYSIESAASAAQAGQQTATTQAPAAQHETTQSADEQSKPVAVHYEADVTMANRFLLTLANEDRTKVPFDVDVLINGKHAATLSYLRGSSSIDVSQYVTRGENTVSFVARKNVSAENHGDGFEMRVLVGVGSFDGKVARYEHILVGMEYKSSDKRSSIRNTQTFKVQ